MISVIMPTYNRANTLHKAILSILNQTYRDLELIVVDDCSTDNTELVVKGIKDERIHYVKHNKNQGACAARNTGIQLAKGEYIAFQDSDDEWLPEKLEKQLKIIKENNADLVFCKYLRDGKQNGTTIGPSAYREGFLNPVQNLYGIGTQTLFAKAEVFKSNRFDVEMPRFQDLELLMRISENYSIYCMDDVLVKYNLSYESISQKNPVKLYNTCLLLLQKHPTMICDYPVMCKSITNILLNEATTLRGNNELLVNIFKLSFKFEPDVKCILKIVRTVIAYNFG